MTVQRFEATFEAKTPVSHGADSNQGTRTALRTEKMAMPSELNADFDDIPVVSGNSLRGQFRDLLARDFLDMIDVELHDTLSNTFWSGGTPESGSGAAQIRRRRIESVRELIPTLSILGGSIGSSIMDGKLKVGRLVPIGIETQNYTGVESDNSVWDYKDKVFYTRIDDKEGSRTEDEQKQQMKYEADVLVPGTRFHHQMQLVEANEIETAALARALELFDEEPFIGGMSRVGHGKVEHDYDLPSSDPYLEFVDESREEIRDFVLELDEDLA